MLHLPLPSKIFPTSPVSYLRKLLVLCPQTNGVMSFRSSIRDDNYILVGVTRRVIFEEISVLLTRVFC